MSIVKSSKPKKQRKKFYSSALHEMQKQVHVHLSKELRGAVGKKSIGARKEDKVKIMRGKFAGKEGKIVGVNRKKKTIFVDGITRKKSNGKEVFVPLHPSNLMIVDLFSGDKKRLKKTSGTGKKQPVKKMEVKN